MNFFNTRCPWLPYLPRTIALNVAGVTNQPGDGAASILRIGRSSCSTRPCGSWGGEQRAVNPMVNPSAPAPPASTTMRFPPAQRLVALATATCLSLALCAPAVAACVGIRPADQILEVNVRPACCSTSDATLAEKIIVREYAVIDEEGSRRWTESDLSQLITAPSEGVVTLFHVHGNKVDPQMARDRGLRVYRRLVCRATDDRPVRFVIFSWPATEIGGLLHDFRVKAARTQPVGWQLAWVLDQMPSEAPVSLIGYSYGARIVGGAMHVLAGGDLCGASLPGAAPGKHPPMRVAFMAAATHSCWFGPNGYHHLAMDQIEHLVMLNNHLDPAMRFYKLVPENCSPQAMGLCGPTSLTPEHREKVECYDCANCVGRSHDLFKYTATGRTMTRVWQHVMYAD